jgi:hypothetical protein
MNMQLHSDEPIRRSDPKLSCRCCVNSIARLYLKFLINAIAIAFVFRHGAGTSGLNLS